jgi:hypothetical protein
MNTFKFLPVDIVRNVLCFSETYYEENYKNRNGIFYKQIEKSRINAIANVFSPIKRRCIKERFTGNRTYFWERLLGGKFILYIEDISSILYDAEIENIDYDDEDYDDENYENQIEQIKINPEKAYRTVFCRVPNHPHRGYGIEKEHYVDTSVVYTNL